MDRPVFLIDHGGVKLYPDAPCTSEGSREYEHGVSAPGDLVAALAG
jgi:hypothetical protein